MSDIRAFADDVIDKFRTDITDSVFCFIQADRELVHKYLRLVSEHSVDDVNRQIGKAVKSQFDLQNAPTRSTTPRSVLIRSYQDFVRPGE